MEVIVGDDGATANMPLDMLPPSPLEEPLLTKQCATHSTLWRDGEVCGSHSNVADVRCSNGLTEHRSDCVTGDGRESPVTASSEANPAAASSPPSASSSHSGEAAQPSLIAKRPPMPTSQTQQFSKDVPAQQPPHPPQSSPLIDARLPAGGSNSNTNNKPSSLPDAAPSAAIGGGAPPSKPPATAAAAAAVVATVTTPTGGLVSQLQVLLAGAKVYTAVGILLLLVIFARL